MAWRVHLANSAIRTLQGLPTPRPMLASWTTTSHVNVFDLNDGAPLLERTLPPLPPTTAPSDIWGQYLENLQLPGDAMLTQVSMGDRALYLTRDGQMRLHWDGKTSLTFVEEDAPHTLDTADVSQWLTVDFDRDLGTTAAIADDGKVYLYEKQVLKGSYDIGLKPDAERRCHITIQRGQHIYATDGRTVAALGANGAVRKRISLHYHVAHLASTANGKQLALVDYEDGILRLYRAADLLLTHQKFAIDLVAQAQPRQLLEELPPPIAAVSSVMVTDDGIVCFTMGGVICTTHQDAFTPLPR